MTSLLEPDMGTVMDRLSILELKIDAGLKRSVPTEAWEEEKRQLDHYMQNKLQVLQSSAKPGYWEAFQSAYGMLHQVNWKLWQAEDEIRKLRKDIGPGPIADWAGDHELVKVAELALRIADLNDARSDLVQKINGLFGVQAQEKIYV